MSHPNDIVIGDKTLPWTRAKGSDSVFDNAGPQQTVIFIAAGAMMLVTPTNQTGSYSGRTRYRVECKTCNTIVHSGSTSATNQVRLHLCDEHDWDGAPATIVAEAPAIPAFANATIDGVVQDCVVGHVTEKSPPARTIVPPPAIEPASTWVTNKTRPSWSDEFIMQAYVTALRGSCLRKRVGAIIVDGNNRIISGGFNGAPSKMPDCLSVGCDVRLVDGRQSCVRTLHAESNALDYAGRNARGCALFTTVIPCRPCAMRIVQAGIDSVYYSEYYESQGTKETKEFLTRAGVRLVHWQLPDNELTLALRRAVGEIS